MRPGMIEVTAGSTSRVQTKLALSFWKLMKEGTIPEYQSAHLMNNEADGPQKEELSSSYGNRCLHKLWRKLWQRCEVISYHRGKLQRQFNRAIRWLFRRYIKVSFL